jgi:hypothetical protein
MRPRRSTMPLLTRRARERRPCASAATRACAAATTPAARPRAAAAPGCAARRRHRDATEGVACCRMPDRADWTPTPLLHRRVREDSLAVGGALTLRARIKRWTRLIYHYRGTTLREESKAPRVHRMTRDREATPRGRESSQLGRSGRLFVKRKGEVWLAASLPEWRSAPPRRTLLTLHQELTTLRQESRVLRVHRLTPGLEVTPPGRESPHPRQESAPLREESRFLHEEEW